jgi:F-type H+-transporting ATPase subunit epsilon
MADDAAFELQIITPERTVFSGSVVSVSCPGTEGRFQILGNHAPFLAALAVGEMWVRDGGKDERRYAVGGGISQVYRNSMLILADSAERSDEIDVARAEEAKQRAERRLETTGSEIDFERARSALFRAINRLKIAANS